MGRSICGGPAALVASFLLGFSPAFAEDAQPGAARLPARGMLEEGPCPTRFDYVVLASFGDGASLLSLSTYRFRSNVGYSPIPLTGFQRVAYTAESGGAKCRSHRRPSPQPG